MSLQLNSSSHPYTKMPRPPQLVKFLPTQPCSTSKPLQSTTSPSIAQNPNHFKLALADNGETITSHAPVKKLVAFRSYNNGKKAGDNIFKTILFNVAWSLKELFRTILYTILFGGISLIVIFLYQILKTFVTTTTNVFWSVVLNILSLFPGKSLPARFWSIKKISYKKINHDASARPIRPYRTETKNNKPLTLVLDLDETLIHASRSVPIHGDFDTLKFSKMNGEPQQIYLRKRPYLTEFLEKVSAEFNLIIYTASRKEYADTILDFLDRKNVISKRLYRESCIKTTTGFLKDLTQIEPTLSRIILLDNSLVAGSLQPENYLPIKSWFHDEADQFLQHYTNFFLECAKKWKADTSLAKDIRKYLRTYLYQGKHQVNKESATSH